MVNGNRMSRRILHTSDLHLLSLGDRACHSLEALVDLASQAKVDLVIIAGDLFDHNRVSDSLVNFVAEQLQRLPGDVAILPGNHDCLVPGSVFDKGEPWEDCANVHIFRIPHGGTLDLPGLGVSLWGKSINSYVDNVLPLAGIPQPRGNGQWHIAVAHGYYVDTEPPLFPSYHITHEEITTSGWDYIALGHVITFRCICNEPVKAYYSGSPSLSGTVAIVDLGEETGVQVTPYYLRDKYMI
ncbi:MAG: metallophosphoesterase [Chloroflexi bacterium]|nr:metallophosphoesterase [Chloroflexota bacterium]